MTPRQRLAIGAAFVVAGVGALLFALRESPPPGTPFPGPCRTALAFGDGVTEETVYTYDDQGREVERAGDQERIVTSYDTAGNATRKERWRTGTVYVAQPGGKYQPRPPGLDSVEAFTYDDAGRVASRTYDRDGDGTVDWRGTRTNDERGRQVGEHAEWERHTSETTFRYANGHLVEKVETTDGDHQNRTIYENDANGHPTGEWLYVGSSRTAAMIWRREWDSEGRLVQEEDGLGDGTWDRRARYERDEDGNITKKIEGLPPDGPWHETTYDYDCWSWSGGRWTR
jgi:hypothetical protein